MLTPTDRSDPMSQGRHPHRRPAPGPGPGMVVGAESSSPYAGSFTLRSARPAKTRFFRGGSRWACIIWFLVCPSSVVMLRSSFDVALPPSSSRARSRPKPPRCGPPTRTPWDGGAVPRRPDSGRRRTCTNHSVPCRTEPATTNGFRELPPVRPWGLLSRLGPEPCVVPDPSSRSPRP